jgi:hypothetical protein
MPKKISENNEILRGVVGSTCHGTAIEKSDDRDEMGIFVEPPEKVCGLETCDHYIFRTQPDGHRSGPGDLDLVMYSLRKFCRLAEHGNPSVLLLLFLPKHIVMTELGADLISMRKSFISKNAGKRYLGYLRAQKEKTLGIRCHTVNRPELVEKYGYDTKFAHHALRLGYQGIELLRDGDLVLPIREPELTVLRDIRVGEINFKDCIALIEATEAELERAVDLCCWDSDRKVIDEFLVDAHMRNWQEKGYV